MKHFENLQKLKMKMLYGNVNGGRVNVASGNATITATQNNGVKANKLMMLLNESYL